MKKIHTEKDPCCEWTYVYLQKRGDGKNLFPRLAPKNWRVTKSELFRILLFPQSKMFNFPTKILPLPRATSCMAQSFEFENNRDSPRNPITTLWGSLWEIMVVRPTNNPFHSFSLVSREWGSWVVWGMVFRPKGGSERIATLLNRPKCAQKSFLGHFENVWIFFGEMSKKVVILEA